MGVTADSTLWTADTTCVTADGRVICIDADIHEASAALDALDAVTVAEAGIGYVITGSDASFVSVSAAAGYIITGSDASFTTTAQPISGYVLTGFDAVFVVKPVAEAEAVGGGAHYPRRRPLPVVGHGFGILPQLRGEALGLVGVVGAGAGTLSGLIGEASGSAGVAGRSEAQLLIRAAATGAAGIRGAGAGMIVKFGGTATGRQDDDEAAVIAFLLAA